MTFLAFFYRRIAFAAVVGMALAGEASAWEGAPSAPAPFDLPPVIFEGFGIEDFGGDDSAVSALRQSVVETHAEESLLEFKGIAVHGPTGRDAIPTPMAAELQSRIDWIDVAAGVAADPGRLDAGPNQWTGRIGLSSDRESGSETLELRTMLVPSDTASMVGVAVGPKFERRFRRGLTLFIDGMAEAQAFRSADTGWLASPPGAADGSLATLGVTARTGIMR